MNQSNISETYQAELDGCSWKPFEKGGLLTIRHLSGNKITVMEN